MTPLPPNKRLAEAKAFAEAYAKLIDDGHYPGADKRLAGQGISGARAAMATILGITGDAVAKKLITARQLGVYDVIQSAEDRYYARQENPADAPAPIERAVQEHRLIAEVRRLKAENRALLEKLTGADDFRSALAGLGDPLEPVSFQSVSKGVRTPETVLLALSDLQWGETIDLAAMDGLNSYNADIARERLARVFDTWVSLMTRHWAGPPPERVILALGGDLISGEIHEELAKSNSLLSIPALRDAAAHICAGIRMIRDSLPDTPIDIISVPGNHGRTTRRPESKLYAAHSYDTLCADLIELEFKEGGGWPDWFRMFKPYSGDALIWVYGYRVLITHGDRIGSRGGAGFVGTAATVARGFKKLVMDYAGRGITLDFIICGHFHTPLQLEEGICNGCLPGPSEYSRDLRFRPRPAAQAFVSFHARRGVSQIRWVDAGDPSEGALYEPKTPPADGGKPRFRIPAIGERV